MRIAYIAHSLRSDWNNGNAHFLRGLLRAMIHLGHEVAVYEQLQDWSIDNLLSEPSGEEALAEYHRTYPEIAIRTLDKAADSALWKQALEGFDIVILHEWNPPLLAQKLLSLRKNLRFRLLFHDTHHRASSSPEKIEQFGLREFDGVLAFGESLRTIYRNHFQIQHVWTLHEAADTTVFSLQSHQKLNQGCNIVWIGNWGDDERSREIGDFFLKPASILRHAAEFSIYGVRYPRRALEDLAAAGVYYRGYLPNLRAPRIYASTRATIHIPRQQYSQAMQGIPTIRVFEALASGVPLVSAPWQDEENLFRPGDICFVRNTSEAVEAIRELLLDPSRASEQARRGLETILLHHTCFHRAQQLSQICEDILS